MGSLVALEAADCYVTSNGVVKLKIKNNTLYGVVIALISIFDIQVILREIDVSEISTQIYTTIALTISITFSFIMIRDRNKGLGSKLNIAAAIVTSIALI